LPVDSKKLDAVINYTLTSWNDYHKSKGIIDRVVERKDISRKTRDILRSIGQFFLDESRGFGHMINNSPPATE